MLVTEELQRCGVGIEEPALEISQVDAINGGKEGLVPFLTLPQGSVQLPALRRPPVWPALAGIQGCRRRLNNGPIPPVEIWASSQETGEFSTNPWRNEISTSKGARSVPSEGLGRGSPAA
jgi:hypothetical protein